MIAIYRTQKASFQKVFDAMMHRMHVLKKVFPPEETEFIRELEMLLSVDDLLLNSTHVVLILHAMKFLKDKRNEGTMTGGQTSAIDRHRYIGLHLVILLQFRHVLEATSLQGSVFLNSIQSITLKLQQLAEKYKPMLDHDQPEKARVETTLHILNFTSSRSEALLLPIPLGRLMYNVYVTFCPSSTTLSWSSAAPFWKHRVIRRRAGFSFHSHRMFPKTKQQLSTNCLTN